MFLKDKKINKIGNSNRLYLGNWLIYQTYVEGDEPIIPPSGEYTELKYIANGTNETSEQLVQFNLGVNINERTKFQICYELLNGSGGFFLGESTIINDSDDYRLFNLGKNTVFFDVKSGRISAGYYNFGKNENNAYELEVGNLYIKDLIGGYETSRTSISAFSKGELSLWRSDGLDNIDKAKVYWLKIYYDDNLIRDLIPTLDKNGVPSFFDKLNNKFYYNEGNGELFYE